MANFSQLILWKFQTSSVLGSGYLHHDKEYSFKNDQQTLYAAFSVFSRVT